MATPVSPQQSAIAYLYAALFNRAPDAAGFRYWEDALARGLSMSALTQTFLNAPEAKAIYPSAQTSAQFVLSLYQTVFGRAPDAGGLAFWAQVLDASGGPGSDAAKASVVLNLISVASTPLTSKPAGLSDAGYTQTVTDRATLINKGTVGVDVAVTLGINELALAKQVLAMVTWTHASVDAALAFAVAGGSLAPVGPVAGQAFDFTPDVDTLIGGDGNDTFTGDHLTVQLTDSVNGGAGIDTFRYINASPMGVALPALTTHGVELLNLRNVNTIVVATRFAGATQFNSDNSTLGVEFTDLAAGQALGILGDGTTLNGNVTGTYTAGVSSATLNIAGGVTQGSVVVSSGIRSLTVNSTGAVNTLTELVTPGVTHLTINAATNLTVTDRLEDNSLLVVTVTGAAALVDIGLLPQHIRQIDASGLTAGGVRIDLDAAPSGQILIGGAGNDTINIINGRVTGNEGGDAINVQSDVRIIYTAASDSLLDLDGVAGITGAGKQDVVTNFQSVWHKIDLSGMGFLRPTWGLVAKSYEDSAQMLLDAATSTFYQNGGGTTLGAVIAQVGLDSFLFADANHDGVFRAATDLVVKLAGAQTLTSSNIIWEGV